MADKLKKKELDSIFAKFDKMANEKDSECDDCRNIDICEILSGFVNYHESIERYDEDGAIEDFVRKSFPKACGCFVPSHDSD